MALALLDDDGKLATPTGAGLLFMFATFCYVTYLLAYAFYNVYLHPLSKFPGPKSWIAFPILRHIAAARGLLDERIREFHARYGEVVRYTSLEVSFITADAWKDIYGHGHTLQKWAFPPLPGEAGKKQEMDNNILAANDTDHARYRKSLSHAFSEKALRDQEPIMKVYIDLLIEKLKDVAESREKTDMMKWYNLTTFDMIGDLAFGDSFDGLKSAKYHDWVGLIFKSIKLLPFLRISADYPLIMRLAMALMPESLTKAKGENDKYARDTVMKRVNNENQHGRGDFMDSMLKHRAEKDGLTDNELVSNGGIVILAGSETTATLLSGVTYWLLRTPEALRKVMDEVRSVFMSEDEINFNNATVRLPYMLACLEEGLRRYPPVPSGLLRWTPPGGPTEIAGHLVPENTIVSVHMSAAYWSPWNFHDPDAFHPERWLPESTTNPSSPFYNDNRAVLQPFSVGPRNCIGRNLAYNEMRLILARVLWNFDIELCEESRHWNEQKAYILWEKPPLMCLLRVRGSST